jgi:hypothetical protein
VVANRYRARKRGIQGIRLEVTLLGIKIAVKMLIIPEHDKITKKHPITRIIGCH